ncbi:MAG: capsule biosynthesis protein [Deltaproteobacteria bacterium]|nr:capsule biosynthesis protein [Deltaproteobacteria bacterium]
MKTLKKYVPKVIKRSIKKAIGWRHPQYPDWRKIINEDQKRWQTALDSAKGGAKVLIATSIGGIAHLNVVDSSLAAALTLRGTEVHVLLCDSFLPACLKPEYPAIKNMPDFAAGGPLKSGLCSDCIDAAETMYQDMGITVHKYSEIVNTEKQRIADELSSGLTTDDLVSYESNGVSVGEHALAGALRFFARGDLANEEYGEQVLRRYFKAALLTVFACEALFESHDFQSVVLHHGIYVPQGLIVGAARRASVRVVTWWTAYRNKCFMFAHGDSYHHALLEEPVSNWENVKWTSDLETQVMDYMISRERGDRDWVRYNVHPEEEISKIEKEIGIDFSKPTIGLLSNVVWDAQLHFQARAFPDMMSWVFATIDYFADRPDLQLLIRAHPGEVVKFHKSRQPLVDEIRKRYPKLPDNIYIIPPESLISTYTTMQQCNAVLIYGTKAAMEMSSRGIPIIVAGEAWIRGKGFTMDASSEEEYISILNRLPLNGRMSKMEMYRARMYAYHFFFRRMIPLNFMVKIENPPSFNLGISNISEIKPGKSIGLDVICRGILDAHEFIYPAESGLEPIE